MIHDTTGWPAGFAYFPTFLGSEECETLLAYLRSLPMKHDVFRNKVMKRASYNFGFDYRAVGRRVTPTAPFSEQITSLALLGGEQCGEEVVFDECSATHYPPGSGIGFHTDAMSFGNYIIGISFGSDARLQFRPNGTTKASHEIVVAPGSLYLMEGPARWEYQHRIVPVKKDRYSLTYRTIATPEVRR